MIAVAAAVEGILLIRRGEDSSTDMTPATADLTGEGRGAGFIEFLAGDTDSTDNTDKTNKTYRPYLSYLYYLSYLVPITLETTIASSRGSTGLATCMRKPAASARKRSSLRPKAVRAMAGICSDVGTPCSASHSLTL